jgi:hypothetical protein
MNMNIEEAKDQIPNLDQLVEGWRFRLIEISPNHYHIEAMMSGDIQFHEVVQSLKSKKH